MYNRYILKGITFTKLCKNSLDLKTKEEVNDFVKYLDQYVGK